MENFQFTEQELKYINDDIFNKENDIYATRLISDKYYIYATLPQGWYSFEVAEDEKMDCLNHLRQEGVNANITYTGIFVNIKKPRTIHILLSTDGEKIVKHLRSILVLQHKRLQQESLIQKDVKTRTDYGEQYNRESMYETAREILLDGKKVVINGKCYDSLIGVMIEDCGMEQEKHEAYIKEFEIYQQAKDDTKAFDSLLKSISRGKVEDELIKRSDLAIIKAKQRSELNGVVSKAYNINKNLNKLSITQIKDYLQVLRKYEKELFECMYGDTLTNLTHSLYKATQKYIEEIEEELKKRQENINL